MPITYLQIGSWNVEHLSKEGGRKESPYALTDHIEMAGIQALALQEVYDTSPPGGQRRNRELTTVCALLEEHSGDKWEYELFPNRSAGDRSQLCGVLWNTALVTKSDAYKINVRHKVDDRNLWDRAPHAVKLSANYGESTKSVVLVPLHMKSNYGGASQSRPVRHLEAVELSSQLHAIREHFRDESLILMGDTNVLDAHEDAVKTYEGAGLVDLNAMDAATYPGYGGSPFDRAFVASGRKEFRSLVSGYKSSRFNCLESAGFSTL